MTEEEWVAAEQDFLDTFDLSSYLISGTKLADIERQIEEDLGCYYIREEFIFGHMTIDEFATYLQNKYPNTTILEVETVEYRVI